MFHWAFSFKDISDQLNNNNKVHRTSQKKINQPNKKLHTVIIGLYEIKALGITSIELSVCTWQRAQLFQCLSPSFAFS